MSLVQLRREVAQLRNTLRAQPVDDRSPERLAAELELHQLELEAQNQELQEAQARLELSQARYSALYHGAPVAFCTLDRQGAVLELNQAACDLLGRSAAYLTGVPLMVYVVDRDRPLFRDHLRQCAERKSRVCTELSLAPGLAREMRVQLLSNCTSSSGADQGFHTAILDVTAERQARQRLLALELAARKLGEARDEPAALDAVCAATVGSTAEVAAACLDSLEGGWLAAAAGPALLAERLRQAIESRTLPAELAELARQASAGPSVMGLSPDLAAWLFQGQGTPATAAIAALEARYDASGWLLAVVRPPRQAFTSEDLLVLQQLAGRLGQSVQSQRLYRKALREVQVREDFLAIVSHDLVNAAASIKLAADTLDHRPGAATQHGTARRIRSAAEWISSVVRKLLDVAAMESGAMPLDLAPVPAGALLEEARDSLAALAEESQVELRLKTARDTWVRADAERILQVFSNLVVNALKHVPAGSAVDLEVARMGPEVRFMVRDQGPGLAKEDLPHVFNRFWQARRARRAGVGLGLSIVKAIVEAHGGRVWVENVTGGGAAFWFMLPAIESPAATVLQAAAEGRQEGRS